MNWAKWYRGCMWACAVLCGFELGMGRYPQALLTFGFYLYALYEWRKALHDAR